MAYRMVAQVTFEAWEQVKTFNVHGWRTKSELAKTFSTLIKLFKKYEHTFPMGAPSLLYSQGCQKWMEGKQDVAFKYWQASAESAKRLAMPWDEANAVREMGKRSEGEAHITNLQKALAGFESSYAIHDTIDAKKLLAR